MISKKEIASIKALIDACIKSGNALQQIIQGYNKYGEDASDLVVKFNTIWNKFKNTLETARELKLTSSDKAGASFKKLLESLHHAFEQALKRLSQMGLHTTRHPTTSQSFGFVTFCKGELEKLIVTCQSLYPQVTRTAMMMSLAATPLAISSALFLANAGINPSLPYSTRSPEPERPRGTRLPIARTPTSKLVINSGWEGRRISSDEVWERYRKLGTLGKGGYAKVYEVKSKMCALVIIRFLIPGQMMLVLFLSMLLKAGFRSKSR